MKTNAEIRLHNFQLLYQEAARLAGADRGAARKMHDLTGVPEALISQIKNGATHKSGARRGIGTVTARKLESGFEKEGGWMDRDHTEAATMREADFLDLLRRIGEDQHDNLLGIMTGLAMKQAGKSAGNQRDEET